MSLRSRIRRTLRNESSHTDEIQEELQFHLDMDAQEGHSGREARLRLGNTAVIGEETRAMGVIEWLDSALRDARFGLRQIRRTPGVSIAIVLSLAIGIGANTGIFSLVDAALLRALPVPGASSLRVIEWTNSEFPSRASNINGNFSEIAGHRVSGSSISASDYRALARDQKGYSMLVGLGDDGNGGFSIGPAAPVQASLQYVSANFFQGLGITLPAGRAFIQEEDRVGIEPSVIVSYRFWVNQLARTVDLAGIRARFNNIPVHVVGVAPSSFFGLQPGEWMDVYAPLAARIMLAPRSGADEPRGEDEHDWWVRMVGKPRPGISTASALGQIRAIFRHRYSAGSEPLDPAKIPELVDRSGARGIDDLGEKESSALWILMTLVAVLLLIVCANVANLLLARSVRRQRESAVRLALGAARGRLFRQHLIESSIVGLLGGVLGLLVGYALAHLIHALFEAGRPASFGYDLHLDPRVLGYTAALSFLTAMIFGLAPAIRAARAGLNDTLKATSRSLARGGLRLPRVLVAVQLALCLAALVAAGLLGRSLQNLKTLDIGFDRENLVYASVDPSQAGYDGPKTILFIQRLSERLARLPGVASAGYIQVRPLSGSGNVSKVAVPGRVSLPMKGAVSSWADAVNRNRVGEGGFDALGIPLASGRFFDARDYTVKSDAVIVDEAFVHKFFAGRNPVGLRFGFDSKKNAQYEIVGVVRNSRYNTLRTGALPVVFQPLTPDTHLVGAHFAIRAHIESQVLQQQIRKAVAEIDPAVPITQFRTQNGLIDSLLRTERLLGFVSGAFSFFALALAAIGLGSLLSYLVARRTNEIGVRMAVGASTGDVISLVLRDSLWMVISGLAIGLPCAWFIGKYLKSALFGLKPVDPLTAATALGILLAIALLAAWIPARRAARINPVVALREE